MLKKHSLLAAILLPLYSIAWNAMGHSTGGAIAYYYLKQNNPAVITKITDILKSHPWYSRHGAKGWADRLAGLTSSQKEVTLFMLASVFPDEARGTSLAHDSWHFVDYPFVPADAGVEGHQPETINAQSKIEEFITSIPTQTDKAEKAIDLCWLFHLIEDVHQPLHAASMYTDALPEGDRGGNYTYIKFSSGGPVKLHSYWDGLIKGSVSNAPGKARALLGLSTLEESQLTELQDNPQPSDWIIKESLEIAKKNAYLDGSVTGTQSSPTRVNNSYAATSTTIAEKRIVLAGIRLAKTFATIL